MTYTLEILPKTEVEIREARDYYLDINEQVLERLHGQVMTELQTIQDNPLLFQVRYDDQVRVRYLNDFPFGIHYTSKAQQFSSLPSITHQGSLSSKGI